MAILQNKKYARNERCNGRYCEALCLIGFYHGYFCLLPRLNNSSAIMHLQEMREARVIN